MSEIRLKITERSADYHCCLDGNDAVWDPGKTPRQAVYRWVLTHGAGHGVHEQPAALAYYVTLSGTEVVNEQEEV